MNDLVPFYENFDSDQLSDDCEILADEITTVHKVMRIADARAAVYSGKRLMKMKKMNYGRFDELYEAAGISRQTADNYIILAKTYGKNPEILEGMSQRKALLLARQNDREDIVQFIADELWRDPKGNFRTTVEVRGMLIKDEENKHTAKINTKNQELRYLTSIVNTSEIEIKTMRVQDREREQILKESLTGETKTLYEKTKALEEKLARKDAKINDLELELEEKQEEIYTSEEVIEAVRIAINSIEDVVQKYNNVKPGQCKEARYEMSKLLNEMHQFSTRIMIKNSGDEEELDQ